MNTIRLKKYIYLYTFIKYFFVYTLTCKMIFIYNYLYLIYGEQIL
jgi:hypothetical protein